MKNQESGRLAGKGESNEKTGSNSETAYSSIEFDELIQETKALASYIARHGDTFPTGQENLYDNLLTAIKDAKSNTSACDCRSLMDAYAKVTAITYKEKGVNGRTILDTQAKPSGLSWKWLTMPKYRPGWIGVALFSIAMCLDASARWIGNIFVPSEFFLGAFFYHLLVTFTTFLVPAIWGGIGVISGRGGYDETSFHIADRVA